MSEALPYPELDDFVRHLDSAQKRHLRLVLEKEAAFEESGNTDEEVPAMLLEMIGSIPDAPADLRENPKYLYERFARHGVETR